MNLEQQKTEQQQKNAQTESPYQGAVRAAQSPLTRENDRIQIPSDLKRGDMSMGRDLAGGGYSSAQVAIDSSQRVRDMTYRVREMKELAAKMERGARFLQAHPEFEEFLALKNEGIL